MKRTKEFNNILDECLERLLVKGETIEQCLQSYPEHAVELKPLLQTVMATKKTLAIQPHPEFKAKARYQFHSALQELKPKRVLPFLGWQMRWATVVAIALALLLAGGGTVAAAGSSMPDSPIYPVKLAMEQVQMALTISNINKAKLYAKLADRRVVEIISIANRGKPEQIESTAQRLDSHLAMIASLSLAEKVRKEAPTLEVPAPRQPQPAELPTPRPQVEEHGKGGGKPAPVVKEVPLPPERAKDSKKARIMVDRRATLRATVLRQAIKHPERLRDVLKTAPESAKLALQRAIAISENGYKKAIKALD